MNRMRRGVKGPVTLKFCQRFLLLALGLGCLIGGMAVYEKLLWLFAVLAAAGALLIFIAVEGGRELRRGRRTPGINSAAAEPPITDDLPFNPWDEVSAAKRDE